MAFKCGGASPSSFLWALFWAWSGRAFPDSFLRTSTRSYMIYVATPITVSVRGPSTAHLNADGDRRLVRKVGCVNTGPIPQASKLRILASGVGPALIAPNPS